VHSFIADAAFDLFREIYSPSKRRILPPKRRRQRAEEIVKLHHKIATRAGSAWILEIENPRSIVTETENLADRLTAFFFEREATVELQYSPRFRGCGIISDSFGDVLAGNTLYEIKTAERPYRSVDLRQTLVYAALNHSSRTYTIVNLALLNPRLGTFLRFNIESLVDQLAGKAAAELFGDIIHFVSADMISV
jgi:hypothetical protein